MRVRRFFVSSVPHSSGMAGYRLASVCRASLVFTILRK
jgi:hypothetical protein